MSVAVTLVPWSRGDLPLLTRLLGDPAMTAYLGGPESLEKLRERQVRYENLAGHDRMFKIVDPMAGPAGSVGFWTTRWEDREVYEAGWSVLPECQGRGIAAAAIAQAIGVAAADAGHRYLHAFPRIDNGPSNAVCRRVGFALRGRAKFEYPKGHPITVNDWRVDLNAWQRPVPTR
jgi:RimJ/RimL family protein N-acetyltransferase